MLPRFTRTSAKAPLRARRLCNGRGAGGAPPFPDLGEPTGRGAAASLGRLLLLRSHRVAGPATLGLAFDGEIELPHTRHATRAVKTAQTSGASPCRGEDDTRTEGVRRSANAPPRGGATPDPTDTLPSERDEAASREPPHPRSRTIPTRHPMPRLAPVAHRAWGAGFERTANAVPPTAKNSAADESSSSGDGLSRPQRSPPESALRVDGLRRFMRLTPTVPQAKIATSGSVGLEMCSKGLIGSRSSRERN